MSINQTKRPNSCSNDSGDGGVAWDNPSSASATSGDGATCTLNAGQSSQWLMCTNCSFAIPSGAVMIGNEPTFDHWASLLSMVKVTSVRLVKDNTRQDVEAIGLPAFSILTLVSEILGGQTTLLSGEVTQVNTSNSGYGFAIRCQNQGLLPTTVHVRNVQLTVYYMMLIVHPMTGVVVG